MSLKTSKKIRALFNFELLVTNRFPLSEFYFLTIFSIVYLTINGISYNGVVNSQFRDIAVNKVMDIPAFTILFNFKLVLFINSLFLGLFIITSFSNNDEKNIMKLLLSYPVSKQSIFLFKFIYYFILSLIVIVSSVLVAYFNYPIIVSLELVFFTIWILILNSLVTLTLGLSLAMLIDNSMISMVIVMIIWSLFFFFLPISSDIFPKFVVFLIYPQEIFKNFPQNLDDFYLSLISVLLCLIVYLGNLIKFKRKEILY
ncbi:MAG: hypothetical protein HeimC3_30290 [Candidatus Heimdallarchaeota archaeon LC_3]|nr:MAG: hypothetical protein HeimC3_30290 [Candidatus Heimdallarchaeota archaeon LC_3]